MTSGSHLLTKVLGAIALVALGAAGTVIWQRTMAPAPMPTAPAPMSAPMAAASTDAVTLTPELMARAGVRMGAATAGAVSSTWRAPGSVEANAYAQVSVTPLAGGRVTRVSAELGQLVGEGQPIAEIYSPELAEAERAFLAAKADLLLAEQKLARVERLGAIGAVATQEVEDARAEHARQATAVEGARSRVRLLGVGDDAIAALKTAADITASVRVLAPSAGTIINRAVNRGQNVDAGTELVVIADLSTVWVIADVYERDMTAVTRGASARVTTTALPGRTWTGRVTYVDPQVDPATRTLKARVEVTNPGLALKPGQLVDVALGVAAAPSVLVPVTAIQQMGEQRLVFVPSGAAGRFEPRAVTIGRISGQVAEVLSGLAAGDRVVIEGAFALKAEYERTGGTVPSAPSAPRAPGAGAPVPSAQRVELKVTEKGFEPERVLVTPGVPIELVVTRETDATCGTDILIGESPKATPLPLHKAVTIRVPPLPSGQLTFQCGMKMLKGQIVVR